MRNTPNNIKPILLRYREAAAVLGVSESQVTIWARSGVLTPIPIPGIRAKRIAIEECEALARRWRAEAEAGR